MLLNTKIFNLSKIILGIFLVIFFGQLLPYRMEIFSFMGIFSSYSFPLNISGLLSPLFINVLWGLILSCSILIIFKKKVNIVSLILFLLWLGTISKIPFFLFPPHLGYIGFTLLTLSFVENNDQGYLLPKKIYSAFWFIIGLSYATSATAKLLSSSEWATGEMLKYLLESPVTYEYFLTSWLKTISPEILTWFSKFILILEFLIFPLSFLKNKKIVALAITILHLGILLICRIPDISLILILTAWIFVGRDHE